jgi:HAD superfamily hydrolase (TIGR01450 family)
MIKAVIFDLDGTLYRGKTPVPGAAETLAALRAKGVKTLFLTNAATMCRAEVAAKLNGMGLKATKGEVYCGAYLLAHYIAQNHKGRKVYVVGEKGIFDELKEAGIATTDEADVAVGGIGSAGVAESRDVAAGRIANAGVVGSAGVAVAETANARGAGSEGVMVAGNRSVAVAGDDETAAGGRSVARTENAGVEGAGDAFSDKAGVVAVGLDRKFTYDKLAKACHALKKGAVFLASNTDATYPVEGNELPGAGGMVAAIEAVSRKRPHVVGKPNPYVMELIEKEHRLKKSEILVVGDRLETDITFAKNCGVKSALVLSGASKRSDIRENGVRPDYVFESVAELVSAVLSR